MRLRAAGAGVSPYVRPESRLAPFGRRAGEGSAIRIERGDERRERAHEPMEQLVSRDGPADALGDEGVDDLFDPVWVECEQSDGEVVGACGSETPTEGVDLPSEPAVIGDDDVGAVDERRGDDVAVLAVDALDRVAAVSVGPGVECQCATHLLDPLTERYGVEVREPCEQRSFDLVEDPGGDDRLVEVVVECGEEQVAGQDRHEHVGVEDCEGSRHVRGRFSVVETEVFGVSGHLVEDGAPFGHDPVPVGEQVGEQDAAVGTDLAGGQGAVVDELDDGGA